MDLIRSGAGRRMSAGVRFGDTIWLAGRVVADHALGVRGQTAAILQKVEARLASPDYLVEISVVAAAGSAA